MNARSRRRWWMFAACGALVVALLLVTTTLVLPAMAHDRIAAELRTTGFPDAQFRVRRVGLGAIVLTDVRLDADLSIERVEATLDPIGARVHAVNVDGLRWTVDASGEGLRESALARLLDGDRPPSGSSPPIVRLTRSHVIVEHGARAWVVDVEGTVDPADERARLTLVTPLGEHVLDVRAEEAREGVVLYAEARTDATSDLAEAQVLVSRDGGPIAVRASAQVSGGERWPGVHTGEARVELRATIDDGAVHALDLVARSGMATTGELALDHFAVHASMDGDAATATGTERVVWKAAARVKGGLEVRVGGALPLELARWTEALGEDIGWELAGPVPSVFLERRIDGLALTDDVPVALRGTARREPSGAWALDAVAGTVAFPRLLVPSANAALDDVRVEVVARATVHDGAVAVELEPGSRVTAARASLEEVHTTGLEADAVLGVRVDPTGVRVRATAPLTVRTERFAIGAGASALRFEDAAFTLRERPRRALVAARPSWLGVSFELQARARRVRGVLRGARVDASGSLDVEIRPEGARIALPLEVRAAHLAQRDSEASLAGTRVTLPLSWSHGSLQARGHMEARSLAWRGTPLGRTQGAVELDGDALRLRWTAPATDTTSFRLDATVALDGTGRGSLDVEVPASDVSDDDPLQRLLATLTEMRVQGRVEGDVHVDLASPERGRARLVLSGADVEEVEGAGRARDVHGTLRFQRLEPLVGAGDGPVTWSELELGEVVHLGPGSAALRFVPSDGEAGSEIAVFGMNAAAAGGHVRLAPFRFDWEAPVLELEVTVDGVELRRVVRALTDGRASATGHVDGRVAFRVELGERRRVLLGPGRLAARGAGRILVGEGRLETLDEAQLATLIEGEWVQRRVLAALVDFEYDQLVLVLHELEGTRRLRAHVLGRGRTMPQELDLTLNVRGVQPLLDQALRLWPTGGADARMEVRQQ